VRACRTSQNAGGNITRYLWDGLSRFGDVVLEADATNAVVNRYILANGA
jgi:hypothetical protein